MFSAGDFEALACPFDPRTLHLDAREGERRILLESAADRWRSAALSMSRLVENMPLAGAILRVHVEAFYGMKPIQPGDRWRFKAEVATLLAGERMHQSRSCHRISLSDWIRDVRFCWA